MSEEFDYLIEKIENADFTTAPFEHVYIEDFLSDEHFEEIRQSPEINLGHVADDDQLFESMFKAGYKIVEFPGCVTSKDEYIAWHEGQKESKHHHTTCESFGITLRLYEAQTPLLARLKEFFHSETFNGAMARKFGVELEACTIDGGVQKYLDGYEISPHPDIRRKAATFMVNINPTDESENLNHHTHYMTFKPSRRYVQAYWEGNADMDRCWVPWDWCDTAYQQTKNNSIVLFSPSNDTIHAVKASYDHLPTQRTQIYGNLWYKDRMVTGEPEWYQFDIQPENSARERLRDALPVPVRTAWRTSKRFVSKLRGDNVGRRDY